MATAKPASETLLAQVRPLAIRRSLWRYLVVGLLSNGVGYSLYLLLTWLGVGPKVSMSILYCVGTALGFIGNRKWSFEHRGKALPSFILYCLAYGIGYALDFFMLSFFVDRLGYPHQLVQAAAVIVVAVFLFLTLNFVVFPRGGTGHSVMS